MEKVIYIYRLEKLFVIISKMILHAVHLCAACNIYAENTNGSQKGEEIIE